VLSSLLAIFLLKATIVGLGAFYVRAQLAVLRGFDLGLAAIGLVAGELVIAFAPADQDIPRWLLAIGVGLISGAGLGMLWSWLLARRLGSRGSPTTTLVASLGIATLASGAVASIRGPGLVQLDELPAASQSGIAPALWIGLAVCAVGAAALAVWLRSRTGFQVSLLDQDRAFAEELGCDPRRVAVLTGLACGTAGAAAGIANAVTSGSTPDSGIALFLQAAAGALIVRQFRPSGMVLGALAVAALYTGVGALAPLSWADFIVFAVLLLLIVIRGRDRIAEEIR
jgi:branched-subunit amino acid ABC-type transport system permease component